jgi:hypothetical protein
MKPKEATEKGTSKGATKKGKSKDKNDTAEDTEQSIEEKKPRSTNWSAGEKLWLVNGVEPVFLKLFGKFSSTISVEVKQKRWTD